MSRIFNLNILIRKFECVKKEPNKRYRNLSMRLISAQVKSLEPSKYMINKHPELKNILEYN